METMETKERENVKKEKMITKMVIHRKKENSTIIQIPVL
jgi:hypothetical protein